GYELLQPSWTQASPRGQAVNPIRLPSNSQVKTSAANPHFAPENRLHFCGRGCWLDLAVLPQPPNANNPCARFPGAASCIAGWCASVPAGPRHPPDLTGLLESAAEFR